MIYKKKFSDLIIPYFITPLYEAGFSLKLEEEAGIICKKYGFKEYRGFAYNHWLELLEISAWEDGYYSNNTCLIIENEQIYQEVYEICKKMIELRVFLSITPA